ncbi:MAG: hypothetical protein CMJ26_01855 [Phycisphaerae bacterium]|nr:hypothetical protein [Phycisphaerae bacterium]
MYIFPFGNEATCGETFVFLFLMDQPRSARSSENCFASWKVTPISASIIFVMMRQMHDAHRLIQQVK